jgi:hypothetical protein
MRTVRKLSLRKESLTELTSDEMASVAGAAVTVPCPYTLTTCVTTKLSAVLAHCPLG